MKDKVKLIDESGHEYQPFAYSSGEGVTKKFVDQERDILVSWQAEFAYGLQFEVESQSSSYTLSWSGYPLLEVGSPFYSPFYREEEK